MRVWSVSVLAVSALLALAQADGSPKQVDASYTFEQYLLDTGKAYNDAAEYKKRNMMFETNLLKVIAHNSQNPPPSYSLGLNDYADMHDDEVYKGHHKQLAHAQKMKAASTSAENNDSTMDDTDIAQTQRHRKLQDLLTIDPVLTLPSSVDWRHQGVTTPIKSQGMCGSCWAFASSAVLESHIALQTGILFEFSEQQLVSCADNPLHCGGNGGCTGSTAEIAFDYAKTNGLLQEWDFSYTSGHGIQPNCTAEKSDPTDNSSHFVKHAVASVAGFQHLPSNNYTVLMNAVAKLGPIAVSVAASPWTLYRDGIFDGQLVTKRDTDINHLVVLEGYGTDVDTGMDYWLVRNSWGPLWGERGYIRLKRVDPETLDDPTTDCGMDVSTADGVACTIDDSGDTIVPPPAKICGTSGILYDSSVPWGGYLVK
jgi:cathepsin L